MGFIQQPDREFFLELASGRARGPNRDLYGQIFKFGHNPAVGLTEVGIQHQGGQFVFPLSAQRVRIRAGGNVADTAGGLGAQTVTVFGIDSTGIERSEVLILDGVNASAWTTNSYWRVFRGRVTTCGTYGLANTGIINIENETDLDLLAQIEIEEGTTAHTAWSTPAGKRAFLISFEFSIESNKTVNIQLYTRENFTTVAGGMSPRVLQSALGTVDAGLYEVPRKPYLEMPPLTDIWMTAFTNLGTANVSASMRLILVPDAI